MLDYARSDTHFLLYVYDMMRNELVDKSETDNQSLTEEVIQNSKQEALQRYERPVYDAGHGRGSMGWHNMLYRSPSLFNREQFAVFRAVHHWRDQVARDEDEGAFSILKNKALFDIARTLPMDLSSLIVHCHPLSKVLQEKKHLLLRIIKEAQASSDAQAEMKDFFKVSPAPSRADHGHVQPQPSRPPEPANSSLEPRSLLKTSASTSVFWGLSTIDAKPSKTVRSQQEIEKLRLILPLPPLDAEIFVDRSRPKAQQETGQEKVNQPSANTQQPESARDKASEVVILRGSNSQKRKIGDENSSPTLWNENVPKSNHIGVDVNQDPGPEDPAKQLKKAERRKRKEMKRLARGEPANPGKEPAEEQGPLDYENAPSVLHAQSNGDRAKASNKPLKPYSKSLNAPKGLGRAQKDATGRSMTFGR